MDTEKIACGERNHFVDALKGVCIVFIIITHFSWSDVERLKYLFPFWIDMAVPIFMIISGYVNSFSYLKNDIQHIGDAYLLKNILNKIVRYTVPFLIVYIIEIVFNLFLGTYESMGITEKIMSLGCGFLTGGFGPGSYYYPVMFQFVFVYPIIHFIIKKYAYKGVAICGFVNAVYELLQRSYYMNEECYRLLVLRYILVIAIGCYLASEKCVIRKNRAIVSCLIGIAFIISVCYLNYSPKIIIYWTRTSFLACLYIIPIAMMLINKLTKIRIKPLEILGRSSYNIFLTQMVWYSYGFAFLNNNISDRVLCFGLNLIICIGVGIVFYFAETPITKAVNKLLYKLLKLRT